MSVLLSSIFLQVGEFMQDIYWIAGAAVVLGIVFFLTKRAQYQQRNKQLGKNDPRQHVVNDSNYNIDREGMDGHRTSGSAERAAEDMKANGEQPTREEFYDLRDNDKGQA